MFGYIVSSKILRIKFPLLLDDIVLFIETHFKRDLPQDQTWNVTEDQSSIKVVCRSERKPIGVQPRLFLSYVRLVNNLANGAASWLVLRASFHCCRLGPQLTWLKVPRHPIKGVEGAIAYSSKQHADNCWGSMASSQIDPIEMLTLCLFV